MTEHLDCFPRRQSHAKMSYMPCPRLSDAGCLSHVSGAFVMSVFEEHSLPDAAVSIAKGHTGARATRSPRVG